jgi:subtilisin-like proprotein convertase family protein
MATNPAATAQISLNSTSIVFTVTNTLSCEHVGLRVATDHPLRGDVRITLVSPSGTRSVLQRYNGDTSAGPVDWTYWSTHHFFESSAGNWTAYFSDEYAGNTGSVQSVSLIVEGVPILDADHDGLDDNWEMAHFGSLIYGPQDDPDHDGYNNMREYLMGTDPMQPAPMLVDLSLWNSTLARLSWNSIGGTNYEVLYGKNFGAGLGVITNFTGSFPETEWFVSYTNAVRFFEVHKP